MRGGYDMQERSPDRPGPRKLYVMRCNLFGYQGAPYIITLTLTGTTIKMRSDSDTGSYLIPTTV